jgi:hypothetical protein
MILIVLEVVILLPLIFPDKEAVVHGERQHVVCGRGFLVSTLVRFPDQFE